ncbi:SRPBCC domain-containing protein [Micromonospora sp. WMMD975]|uniref:SRPBCC domain-containing protein n=1 Tax=Micromonospora sp. WMMD975 TaxID=3016087 RepID=UPI00249A0593|nr:SRPBCC domain-containing protein [Micromonospora sp. WMMD975]WFE36403.1 SRPBCC domain-containing protein [Micromonospora sp. WMMD975]
MTEPAFVHEMDLRTTPERLWRALTDGRVTRRYWFDRRIESNWTPGSPVRFYDGDGDTVTDTGVVTVHEPPRLLSYTFRHELGEGAADGPYTRVSFTLMPLAGDRVRLRLVHDRLSGPDEVEGWRAGWTPILDNLREFVESGDKAGTTG